MPRRKKVVDKPVVSYTDVNTFLRLGKDIWYRIFVFSDNIGVLNFVYSCRDIKKLLANKTLKKVLGWNAFKNSDSGRYVYVHETENIPDSPDMWRYFTKECCLYCLQRYTMKMPDYYKRMYGTYRICSACMCAKFGVEKNSVCFKLEKLFMCDISFDKLKERILRSTRHLRIYRGTTIEAIDSISANKMLKNAEINRDKWIKEYKDKMKGDNEKALKKRRTEGQYRSKDKRLRSE